MDVRELRIGNYLQYFGNIVQVEGIVKTPNGYDIKLKRGYFVSINSNSLEPIPLDEEWLVKFGFEKDDTGVDVYDQDYHEWYQKEFPIIGELCQSSDKSYLFDTNTDTLRIKHVHQLQNLYFALTGEELTLKNK